MIIYDLNGREMYARTFNGEAQNKNQVITLQAKYLLPSGIYLVSVATNGTEFKHKLILN